MAKSKKSIVAPIRYTRVAEQVNPAAFESCIGAITENLRALSVPVNADATNMSEMMVVWARHIAQDATVSTEVFNLAYEGIQTAKDAKLAIGTHRQIHKQLTGRKSWVDWFRLGKSTISPDVVAKIMAHPLYADFQASGLTAAAAAVEAAWTTFSGIESQVADVAGKLKSVDTNMGKLKDPDAKLSDIKTATVTPELLRKSLSATLDKLEKRKPELYNSAHAISALADMAASELHAQWSIALALLDTALSRYYMLCYVGLLMDATIKLKLAGETQRLMLASTSNQFSEMMGIIAELGNTEPAYELGHGN